MGVNFRRATQKRIEWKSETQSNTKTIYAPTPLLGVTGEVYWFSRRQLIFSFGRHATCHISFARFLRVHSEINSVCTTIFKQIAGLRFYPKYLILCINGFVSTSSAKNGKFFSNFKLVSQILAENRIMFKRIANYEYWSNCNVLYISMDSSWQALLTIGKLFSNFKIVFKLANVRKPNIFKRITRCEYIDQISMSLCYISEFDSTSSTKLMESFFFNFGITFWIKYIFLK